MIKQTPPRPLPPGERRSSDVVREIEKAEGLFSTGWHFALEPSAEEIERIRVVHEDKPWKPCPAGSLVAREVVTGNPRRSWTLFRRDA